MMRRILLSLTLAAAAALAGCAGEMPAPQPKPSFAGWVPPPSPALTAYADCLRTHHAVLSDVVGAYVLAEQSAKPSLDAAQPKCQDKADAYLSTITSNSSRQIGDERSYAFIHQVRNCMIRVHQLDLPASKIQLVYGEPGSPTKAQFQACIDEIRAYPVPSS